MALIFDPNEIPLRRAEPEAMTEIAKEEASFVRCLHCLVCQNLKLTVNNSDRNRFPCAIRTSGIHGNSDHEWVWQAFDRNRSETQLRIHFNGSRIIVPTPIEASD